MEELQIKDIYGVWYKPLWQETWFISSGIIITLILMGIVAYWLYKKQYKRPEKKGWELALEDLKALHKAEAKTPKLFYSRLTGILKRYLQSRYALHLVGTTDDELIEFLQENTKVPEPVTQTVKELLNGVVLIKFANQKAAQEQMNDAIERSIKLVHSTKLQEEK